VKSQKFVALGLALAGAVVLVAPARAVPVTIVNPSFENPDFVTPGSFSTNVITGWTGSASSYGVYVPTNTQYPSGNNGLPGASQFVPDGDQAAYTAGTLSISQVLSATLLNDTVYTLGIWIGDRNDASNPMTNLHVELRAGSNILASLTPSPLPADGFWKHYDVGYTSGANDPFAGQALSIWIFDDAGGNGQANFDLVTLDATAVTTTETPRADVPEPMTIALFGGALIGLAAVRRRIAAR
jgi:hypothetical protein